jgi:hypothetical protein
LTHVKDVLQHIYPLDLLDRLATEVVSSLSNVDLLASMRVTEKQTDYEEDTISF